MSETLHPSASDFLTTIVSSKRETLILAIGKLPLAFGESILRGMDPMTRCVINLEPDTVELPQEQILQSDLRVAFHRQNPLDFLNDIGSHRFGVIVIDEYSLNDELANRSLEMLELGGFLIVLVHPDRQCSLELISTDECRSVLLGWCQLSVKIEKQEQRVRRGGRKAKHTKIDRL